MKKKTVIQLSRTAPGGGAKIILPPPLLYPFQALQNVCGNYYYRAHKPDSNEYVGSKAVHYTVNNISSTIEHLQILSPGAATDNCVFALLYLHLLYFRWTSGRCYLGSHTAVCNFN